MNSRHQKILDAILERPARTDLKWRDAEGLLRALGAEITERSGSRVAVDVNGVTAVFHRPHPRPEMDRGAVRDLGRFLIATGVAK